MVDWSSLLLEGEVRGSGFPSWYPEAELPREVRLGIWSCEEDDRALEGMEGSGPDGGAAGGGIGGSGPAGGGAAGGGMDGSGPNGGGAAGGKARSDPWRVRPRTDDVRDVSVYDELKVISDGRWSSRREIGALGADDVCDRLSLDETSRMGKMDESLRRPFSGLRMPFSAISTPLLAGLPPRSTWGPPVIEWYGRCSGPRGGGGSEDVFLSRSSQLLDRDIAFSLRPVRAALLSGWVADEAIGGPSTLLCSKTPDGAAAIG